MNGPSSYSRGRSKEEGEGSGLYRSSSDIGQVQVRPAPRRWQPLRPMGALSSREGVQSRDVRNCHPSKSIVDEVTQTDACLKTEIRGPALASGGATLVKSIQDALTTGNRVMYRPPQVSGKLSLKR